MNFLRSRHRSPNLSLATMATVGLILYVFYISLAKNDSHDIDKWDAEFPVHHQHIADSDPHNVQKNRESRLGAMSDANEDFNQTLEINLDKTYPTPQLLETGSEECYAAIYPNLTDAKTPYKIFIYDLPPSFNVNLIKCMHREGLERCGFGEMVHMEHGAAAITKIWQFSLDIILHHKLMFSPYRTLDPEKADVFYVPFYEASNCLCLRERNRIYNYPNQEITVFDEISKLPYYRKGLPHVLTIAKVESEEMQSGCPLLQLPWTHNVTLLGIEAFDKLRHHTMSNEQKVLSGEPTWSPFIAVPSPSYIHFLTPGGGQYHKEMFKFGRRVFVFLAASTHKPSPFQAKILDQMINTTYVSIDDYYKIRKYGYFTKLNSIWYITSARDGPHVMATTQWMSHSVFCLQPPAGNSPTRKFLFDAILSGCIPVFFEDPHAPVVTYPFQSILDYSQFSVTIPADMTTRFWEVLEPYRNKSTRLRRMQSALQDVMPYMQYSFPIDNRPHTDAMKHILDELGYSLGLQDDH